MGVPEIKPDMLRLQGPRIVFEEVTRMIAANREYSGVSFECGGRGIVSICYTHLGAGMGQPQEYDRAAWEEICLAMRLLGIKGNRHGFAKFVGLSEAVGFDSTRWTVCPGALGEDFLRTFGMLLYRVDQVMLSLYSSRLDILE